MSAQTDKLDSIGIEAICERIECGDTYRELASDYGVSAALLTKWLHADDDRRKRSAYALLNSGEAWLDRGLAALEDADRDSNEIARARAIEQACARRAAIRNPKYSEKHTVALTGEGGGPVKHVVALSDEQLMVIAASGELPKK